LYSPTTKADTVTLIKGRNYRSRSETFRSFLDTEEERTDLNSDSCSHSVFAAKHQTKS